MKPTGKYPPKKQPDPEKPDETLPLSSVQAKLVLLTLSFPRLRIIWSSSPYQTAEIFENLKTQEPEPDPIAAVRAGLDKDMKAEDQVFNLEPHEMLGVVPGVTPQNLKNLTLRTENVREVANMTIEELNTLIGQEAARKVHAFFNRNLIDLDM